ncbi:hypothetical protein YC2023_040797 [Brassica napus]
MTGDSEIVFSPSILSDPFYIFYYNAERNTTVKVRIQGIDFVKNQYIYTFIDHAEDMEEYINRCSKKKEYINHEQCKSNETVWIHVVSLGLSSP